MEFKKYSPDTIAELLIFLADNESFSSLKGLPSFSKAEVSSILHEVANNLKSASHNQITISKDSVKQKEMTDNIHKVISKLTPHEENILLKSFKIS